MAEHHVPAIAQTVGRIDVPTLGLLSFAASIWLGWARSVCVERGSQLAAASIATGHAREWLFLYLLPQRMVVGLLAFTVDYLPHVGVERFTAASDRYKATRNLLGREALLGLLLQGQNYHLVHHLHRGCRSPPARRLARQRARLPRARTFVDAARLNAPCPRGRCNRVAA
jgi:fatty acid desaturase